MLVVSTRGRICKLIKRLTCLLEAKDRLGVIEFLQILLNKLNPNIYGGIFSISSSTVSY